MVSCLYNFFTLLLLLCSVSLVGARILTPDFKNEDNTHIETFISTYLSDVPITIIYDNNTAYNSKLRLNFPKVLYNTHLEAKIRLEKNCSYIFLLDNPQTHLGALDKCTKLDNWNNRQPYLIIIENNIQKRDIKRIFRNFWNVKVFNVVVYYKNNTFYTWYPYEKRSKCGKKMRLVQIAKKNPYLGKLPKRVHSCPININWFSDFFDNNPFDTKNPGAQVRFMNTLAYAMNLNVTYMQNNTDYMKSIIFASNKDAVLLNDMEQRNIDMALLIGNTQSQTDFHRSENSATFFDDDMYLLLPSRKNILKKNYIVDMFTSAVIITIICSFILVGIVWKFLSGYSAMDTTLTLAQLTLQMSIPRQLTERPVKILFLCFIMFMICLNTAFQTMTSSLLTTPSLTPKIKTIDQFVLETDIKIKSYYERDRLVYYNGTFVDFDRKGRIIVGKGSVNRSMSIYYSLKKFVEDDSYAISFTGCSRNYFWNPEQLEMVKKNQENLKFFLKLKKGFPLLENLNYWIEDMRGKGFSEKYGSQYVIPVKKLHAKEPSHFTQTPLRLVHVQGAFHILIFGNLIAMLVFLMEILWKRSTSL